MTYSLPHRCVAYALIKAGLAEELDEISLDEQAEIDRRRALQRRRPKLANFEMPDWEGIADSVGLTPEMIQQLAQAGALPVGGAAANMMLGQDRNPLRRAVRGGAAGLGALAGGYAGKLMHNQLGDTGLPSWVLPGAAGALGGLGGYSLVGSDDDR